MTRSSALLSFPSGTGQCSTLKCEWIYMEKMKYYKTQTMLQFPVQWDLQVFIYLWSFPVSPSKWIILWIRQVDLNNYKHPSLTYSGRCIAPDEECDWRNDPQHMHHATLHGTLCVTFFKRMLGCRIRNHVPNDQHSLNLTDVAHWVEKHSCFWPGLSVFQTSSSVDDNKSAGSLIKVRGNDKLPA